LVIETGGVKCPLPKCGVHRIQYHIGMRARFTGPGSAISALNSVSSTQIAAVFCGTLEVILHGADLIVIHFTSPSGCHFILLTVRMSLPRLSFLVLFFKLSCLSRSYSIANKSITRRQIFANESVDLDSCLFSRLGKTDNCGGVIDSGAPLSMFNCLFERCRGTEGGAIRANSSLSIAFTTAINCSAQLAGFLTMDSVPRQPVSLSEFLCSSPSARTFGALYRRNAGPFHLNRANISNPRASSSVGAFEVCRGHIAISHLQLLNSTSLGPNGGIVVRDSARTLIDNSIFLKCSHRSLVSEAGSAILFVMAPPDTFVKRCSFVGSSVEGGYIVAVHGGTPPVVADCCFAGPAEPVNEMREQDVTKHVAECPTNEMEERVVGYSPGMTRPPETEAAQQLFIPDFDLDFDPAAVRTKARRAVLAVALGIGIVAIGIVALLRCVTARVIGEGMKVPRAFQ
jgi:hypothetical protein